MRKVESEREEVKGKEKEPFWCLVKEMIWRSLKGKASS
jgi:hypothetical protein